jgi:RNA polymerase-interacting CarD/CdnL/TRCF family regulator
MHFEVGEQVVHRVYGLGEIIELDEKTLLGHTAQYYVVRTGNLTLWVQVSDADGCSLRLPTPIGDFEKLSAILSGPAQPLSANRMERMTHLADQLKDGKLASFCRVIRDLTFHRQSKKMNENDKAVLERALSFLLDEWALSNSISIAQARNTLDHLLNFPISLYVHFH